MKDLEEWIKKLKTDSKEKIILVEGMKDRKTLELLGVSNIITLKKPLYAIIEDIADSGKECIILLDLDKAGKKWYGKIAPKLKEMGVKIDNRYREFLFTTPLRQIEGLTHYLAKINQ
jgi:5S rRNA maturation endonuclease (ribonuclease M5)